ncbi:hypothetical protein SLE2022_368830 [Rubroshorea leprosula]
MLLQDKRTDTKTTPPENKTPPSVSVSPTILLRPQKTLVGENKVIFLINMKFVLSMVLLFVGIAVLMVIHIYLVVSAFRRAYEDGWVVRRSIHTRTKRMSIEELKKLPCFEYKEAKTGSSAVDCVVCLENFRSGDMCKLLPSCNHSFHAECIDSWLSQTPLCPICRTCADPSKLGNVGDELA